MPKVSNSLRRFVECELLNYRQNLELLAELREDIILAGSSSILSGSRRAGVSDTTAMKATRLLTNPQITEIGMVLNCINGGKAKLTGKARLFFDLLYDRQHPPGVVAEILGVSVRTVYYAKQEIVEGMAAEFEKQSGWRA